MYREGRWLLTLQLLLQLGAALSRSSSSSRQQLLLLLLAMHLLSVVSLTHQGMQCKAAFGSPHHTGQ
jgi:hypothetical protein